MIFNCLKKMIFNKNSQLSLKNIELKAARQKYYYINSSDNALLIQTVVKSQLEELIQINFWKFKNQSNNFGASRWTNFE